MSSYTSTISSYYGTRLVSSGICSGGCKGSISLIFYSIPVDKPSSHDWAYFASPLSPTLVYGYTRFGYFGVLDAWYDTSRSWQRPALSFETNSIIKKVLKTFFDVHFYSF